MSNLIDNISYGSYEEELIIKSFNQINHSSAHV